VAYRLTHQNVQNARCDLKGVPSKPGTPKPENGVLNLDFASRIRDWYMVKFRYMQ